MSETTVNISITPDNMDEIFSMITTGYKAAMDEREESVSIGDGVIIVCLENIEMVDIIENLLNELSEKIANAGYDPYNLLEKYLMEHDIWNESNPYDHLKKEVDSSFHVDVKVPEHVWKYFTMHFKWEKAKRDLNKKFGGRIKSVLPLENDLFFVLPSRVIFTDGIQTQETPNSPITIQSATHVLLADFYDLTSLESRSNASFIVYVKEELFEEVLSIAGLKLKKIMQQLWNHPNIVITKSTFKELLKTLVVGYQLASDEDMLLPQKISNEIESIMIALKSAGYNYRVVEEALQTYSYHFPNSYEDLPMRKDEIDDTLHLAIYLDNDILSYCHKAKLKSPLAKGDE
jgi:hypothetical protein